MVRRAHEPCRSLVRRQFLAVSPEDPLRKVATLMRYGRFRQLPVVRDARLVGVIDHEPLLEEQLVRLESETPSEEPDTSPVIAPPRVLDRMRIGVRGVTPETPVYEAAGQMLRDGTGFVCVVEPDGEGERVVGIVTERDLLRLAYDSLQEEC